MACPKCGNDTRVIDSRPQSDGHVFRRRACVVCDRRFNTYEIRADEMAAQTSAHHTRLRGAHQAALRAASLIEGVLAK